MPGPPKGVPLRPLLERFEEKIDRTGNCWLWTAKCNNRGYGMFFVVERMRTAHRVAYEMWVGLIPDGLQIDHLCRVKNCVNPAHLETVTASENQKRRYIASGPQILCKRGHELAVHGRRSPDGLRRACHVCALIRGAEARQRRRNA